MNKPDGAEHWTRQIISRLRIGRRTEDERRQRQLKRAHQLAAMKSERARNEGQIY